jgi:predicted nucleic acid-binding protein
MVPEKPAMKPFADTNWLSFYYLRAGPLHEVCLGRMERHEVPLHISPPVLYEAKAVFPRITGKANPAALAKLMSDFGDSVIFHPLDWELLEKAGAELLAKYAHKSEIGALDSLIVASAVVLGCDWFYSFDTGSNARALAAACKLKVFPDLTAEDKARMAELR